MCEGAEVGEQSAAWSDPSEYYHAPCISLGSIYNHTCYEDYPGPLPKGPDGKVYMHGARPTTPLLRHEGEEEGTTVSPRRSYPRPSSAHTHALLCLSRLPPIAKILSPFTPLTPCQTLTHFTTRLPRSTSTVRPTRSLTCLTP